MIKTDQMLYRGYTVEEYIAENGKNVYFADGFGWFEDPQNISDLIDHKLGPESSQNDPDTNLIE
jgi:hypothetical protein